MRDTARPDQGTSTCNSRMWKYQCWGVGVLLALASTSPGSAQLEIHGGTVLMQVAQSKPSFLTFDQLDLDAALCVRNPPGGLGITLESLGSSSLNDPEAIRIYLDEQEKPHSLTSNPAPDFGMVLRSSGKAAVEQCGSAHGLANLLHLCLASIDLVSTRCGDWSLAVTLDPLVTQPVVDWTIQGGNGGGLFVVDITLKLLLTFTQASSGRIVEMHRTLIIAGAGPWNRQAGPGGFSSPSPFEIDTDCDCLGDTSTPETGDFYPGWTTGDPRLSQPEDICLHDGQAETQLCFLPYLLEPGPKAE